jgi:two-component system, LytTR family, response regulator
MWTSVIIDDEKKSRETLHKIIHKYFKECISIVSLAASVKEGVHAIKRYDPKLIFLDIEMPEENGFKLFEYFDYYSFEVIFTTAYEQYAIDAIKYSALDYLLKPINYIDLREVLSRLEEKKKQATSNVQIEAFLSNIYAQSDKFNKIALPTADGFELIRIHNIVYCQAEENYSKIFTNRDEAIIVPKTLKSIENILSNSMFFRIHRSYLVNLNYIKSYTKMNGYKVTLENGIQLEVAMRRNEEFVKALTRRNKSNNE